MRIHSIDTVCTTDPDFDRLPGVQRVGPEQVNP